MAQTLKLNTSEYPVRTQNLSKVGWRSYTTLPTGVTAIPWTKSTDNLQLACCAVAARARARMTRSAQSRRLAPRRLRAPDIWGVMARTPRARGETRWSISTTSTTAQFPISGSFRMCFAIWTSVTTHSNRQRTNEPVRNQPVNGYAEQDR